ncbi:hypothetical protein PLESTF_000610400 [Pleodorina starrii]|nr:hypothetical protein PLESTM_000663400 [Pleodorina starrii]GLC67815.1 hypothetical protein PLESTF_000610400 [Pleodorina starrii]
MLEWSKLCEQVARFASTHAGKRACRSLLVPEDPRETLRLLEQTRAITVLEYDWATSLDYGGIQTSEAESGLSRAAKGGMLSAQQLRAIVTLVNGADRLRKQVVVAARENDAMRPDSPVRVLLAAAGQLRQQPFLVRSVSMAIDEDANVQDSASEQLRGLRARVKSLQARLASMLKGYGGEVSERGGRMCVAVPAGTKISNGVLLGSSPGGSLQYIEPPAVVGANNELGAARAEAAAAEEAVLWDLTGLVMGALEELENTFRVVAWLDVLSARARYSMWIQGVLPEIVPWDNVFHARGGAAMRRRARGEGGEEDDDGGDYGDGSLMRDPDERYAVRLRGLRHPLLYGEYLTQKESLERVVRMSPSAPAANASLTAASASTTSGGGGGSRRRLLGTRKEVLLRRSGFGFGSGSDSDGEGSASGDEANTPQAALAALQPPRPIDWVVRPDTSVVVITGPNTGGKTAAMKALGLAAAMAKAGLALPAEAPARLPAFSSVLADIGDEQSLTANLSTFSGHLRRIQALRAEADGKSLLLLDELGTGTDPLEGAALGVALLKRLVKGGVGAGALTVATTHHSVMTGLKFDDPRFENASVEFDEAALAPTYKLLWGVPGRSNALNIAARLGLDESVVASARSRLDVGVATVNSAIEQLEGLRGQLEAEEKATWDADREVKTLTRKLKAMHSAVEGLHERLTRARAEALLQVYTLARDRIRQIKDAKKRLGRAAPPPKPILAQPAAADGQPDPLAAPSAATATATEEQRHLPSEEEIWEAWEAATRSRTAGAGAAVGVSAAAIGGPKAPAAAVPKAPPPAGAAAAAASADPLKPLLELSGELSDGALGLEALVDDLAAQERQAVMGEALKQQREEAMYDAALAALDDILDVAAQGPRAARQPQQPLPESSQPPPQQQAPGQQPQQQKAKAPRSGRARAASRASAGRTTDEEQQDEDDADLAALMAILEEGEAALNARLRRPDGDGPGQQQRGPGASASGAAAGASGRGQQTPAAAAGQEGEQEEDLEAEFGDLDALVEECTWALRADLQQQQQQQQDVPGPPSSQRHQQQAHPRQQQVQQQQQQHKRGTPAGTPAPSGPRSANGRHPAAPPPPHQSAAAAAGSPQVRPSRAEAEAEVAAVELMDPELDEAASFLVELMEGRQGREAVAVTVGAAVATGAAAGSGGGGGGGGASSGGAVSGGVNGLGSGSGQQERGRPGPRPQGAAGGGGDGGHVASTSSPQQQQQQQQQQSTQSQAQAQRQRRGRRNW